MNDSREISLVVGDIANTLISTEKVYRLVRLLISRSMSATVLYVGDKYLPYTSPIWKIVLGVRLHGDLRGLIGESTC